MEKDNGSGNIVTNPGNIVTNPYPIDSVYDDPKTETYPNRSVPGATAKTVIGSD